MERYIERKDFIKAMTILSNKDIAKKAINTIDCKGFLDFTYSDMCTISFTKGKNGNVIVWS